MLLYSSTLLNFPLCAVKVAFVHVGHCRGFTEQLCRIRGPLPANSLLFSCISLPWSSAWRACLYSGSPQESTVSGLSDFPPVVLTLQVMKVPERLVLGCLLPLEKVSQDPCLGVDDAVIHLLLWSHCENHQILDFFSEFNIYWVRSCAGWDWMSGHSVPDCTRSCLSWGQYRSHRALCFVLSCSPRTVTSSTTQSYAFSDDSFWTGLVIITCCLMWKRPSIDSSVKANTHCASLTGMWRYRGVIVHVVSQGHPEPSPPHTGQTVERLLQEAEAAALCQGALQNRRSLLPRNITLYTPPTPYFGHFVWISWLITHTWFINNT